MGRPDWMKKPEKRDEEQPQTSESAVGRPDWMNRGEETAPSDLPAGIMAEHTVAAGENLSVISEQYYGTQKHWHDIWQANKEQIKDPNVIRAGQVLQIPKLDE